MSGRSSPAGDAGGEAASLRLSVRKDLFPESGPDSPPLAKHSAVEEFSVSCVKLETDFEQSIDDIAQAKHTPLNGLPEKKHRSGKKRKRKRRSSSADSDPDDDNYEPLVNGLKEDIVPRRRSPRDTRSAQDRTKVIYSIKGGKNLNLVSSSDRFLGDETGSAEYAFSGASKQRTDSDDEVLKCSVPVLRLPVGAGGGKPYSHRLCQLPSKKRRPKPLQHQSAPLPSGKPRSMLGITASHSKKKNSRKSQIGITYQSQIVDANVIKIKIRKANVEPQVFSTPVSEVVHKKSKKKKPTVCEESESSGEEYDPSQGESAASISVAAPKPRNQPSRTKKESNSKRKRPSERSESSRQSKLDRHNSSGPQSVWATTTPIPILTKIFEYVVATQGTLPTIIKLGRVCKLWHSVACQPVLWRQVELSPHTRDQSKTDMKLISLLEHRLTMCHTLNLAHWKVNDVACIVACLVDYCAGLEELNLCGWTRLTAEHLQELVQGLTRLRRIDLSLTSETGSSGTCLSAHSMALFTERMADRLTHLSLANNTFTALQQILTSLASHCSQLEVLDISGARATSHPALVPLEALQRGCPRLRVLRAANAQVVLASATTQQKMEAGGFPCLEELSIAAGTGGSGVGEYRLDDDALERLVRGATRLRLLDLRGLARISDSGLVRVPAWDLQHLFLGLCKVTQQRSSCLELVCEKWAHSLLEVDLAWASAARPLDAAVEALADKGADSRLRILNLCGSSVSLEPVKKVLLKCKNLESINLSSCRALPRGMKRLYTGKELEELKHSLDPDVIKEKEETERQKTIQEVESQSDTVSESVAHSDDLSPGRTNPASSAAAAATASAASAPAVHAPEAAAPAEPSDVASPQQIQMLRPPETSNAEVSLSPCKVTNSSQSPVIPVATKKYPENVFISKQRTADSSSTPSVESRHSKSCSQKSPHPKPDTQTHSQDSPELHDSVKGGSYWSLDQFKTTPSQKSEASPLGKVDAHMKTKQCSPITSVDCKPSPEQMQGVKQDIKNPNHWNYGNYSPMPRQDGQYSSHNSPYSAQPSPAQPSPYSAQPSPYSTQPSPYSSQQSPYSQPSPDTSQIVKSEHQKSSANWNLGGYSPMTKPTSQYSPHPSTHTSPDPGVSNKPDISRSNSAKGGQFSPMSRGLSQERLHQSQYSPRPSIESPVAYPKRKSPGMGNYSSMLRSEISESVSTSRAPHARHAARPPPAAPDPCSLLSGADLTAAAAWALDGLLTGSGARAASEHSAWMTPGFPAACATDTSVTLPSQDWGSVPGFDTMRLPRDDADRWAALSDFQVDPPPGHNSFLEQTLSFDALAHVSHQFIDESFAESRVD